MSHLERDFQTLKISLCRDGTISDAAFHFEAGFDVG